ncbi:hypothetical protein KI387_025605, partial [Taxus chinensis]
MKSSLRKLRGFAKPKKENNKESREDAEALADFAELKTAMQDIEEMKGCYESLLSASAMIANCAHEFSQALHDTAICLLKMTALDANEEGGGILKMLGEVQYELHKLFDHYRAHISQTITIPSESQLNELQYVEDLKYQCDEKKKVYEYMRLETAKGKSRNSKVDALSLQKLKLTKEEYDELATLLVCRLMSLKQGQSRSILIQNARHYTAQLQLFRKGLSSLEALEPHLKQIAEEQHIDYQLSELDEDGGASFVFPQSNCERDESAKSENSVQTCIGNNEKFRHSAASNESKSAPFCSYEKTDGIEKTWGRQLETPLHKTGHFYTLPTPDGAWSEGVTGDMNDSHIRMKKGGSGGTVNFQCQMHTSAKSRSHDPRQKTTSTKSELNLGNARNSTSGPLMKKSYISKAIPVSEESNVTTFARPMPLPSSVEMPLLSLERTVASDSEMIKGHCSGPVTGNVRCNKPVVKSGSPLPSNKVETSSKSAPHSPKAFPFNYAKVSPSVSPPHVIMLHQLPRPPTDSEKPSKTTGFIAHSAPLVDRRTKESLAGKIPGLMISRHASPLPPPPPGLVTRSLSIPSFGNKGKSQRVHIAEPLSSPPLTPIPFPSSSAASLLQRQLKISTKVL